MSVPYFRPEEIETRRPVWIALSDLFLDTDSRLNYWYIARVLADAPYSFEELHSIFLDEVSPVLEHNLLQVAGEWAMFDEQWLLREILARQGHASSFRLGKLLVDLSSDWNIVVTLARILRTLPQPARMARSKAWNSLIMLFIDKKYTASAFAPPPEFTLAELEGFFRKDLYPLLFEGARKIDVEANWRTFVTSLGRT